MPINKCVRSIVRQQVRSMRFPGAVLLAMLSCARTGRSCNTRHPFLLLTIMCYTYIRQYLRMSQQTLRIRPSRHITIKWKISNAEYFMFTMKWHARYVSQLFRATRLLFHRHSNPSLQRKVIHACLIKLLSLPYPSEEMIFCGIHCFTRVRTKRYVVSCFEEWNHSFRTKSIQARMDLAVETSMRKLLRQSDT